MKTEQRVSVIEGEEMELGSGGGRYVMKKRINSSPDVPQIGEAEVVYSKK